MTITRITNLMLSNNVLANINAGQTALAQTEEELSSGKKINQPSDDPYGASLADQLNAQLGSLSNYSDNVNDGQAWTSAGLGALSSISDQLQRAQELVVEANNGTQSSSDLNAIGSEVEQLIDGIKSDANTQYNGQYIFSGTSTSTAPYTTGDDVYVGGSGRVTRAINPSSSGTADPSSSVTVNVDLTSVLGGRVDSSGGPSGSQGDLLATLRSIADDLTGDPPTTTRLSGDLTSLSGSLSALGQAQAQLGAASDRLTLASTRISSLQTSTTTELGNVQDADMAATYTTFSNEQAAFTAALKAGASIVQTSLMDFLSD